MNFVLYSEKTVAGCMTALTERLQGSGGKYHLDGWIEKSGRFGLSLESPVAPRLNPKITRRTELRAVVEKENGQTVIRGSVPDGVTPVARGWIYGALILLGLAMLATNQLLIALLLIPVGLVLYVPMKGDYVNCDLLLGEVQRTLKAKFTPIVAAAAKPAAPARPAAKSTATTSKAAPKSAATSKPAGGKPAAKSTAKPASMK